MFSAGFFILGRDKTAINFERGKTVRQYIKLHMSGGRQGYVGCRGITEVVKGSIHNWNSSHKRLSRLGDSDTGTDSRGTKSSVQRKAQCLRGFNRMCLLHIWVHIPSESLWNTLFSLQLHEHSTAVLYLIVQRVKITPQSQNKVN